MTTPPDETSGSRPQPPGRRRRNFAHTAAVIPRSPLAPLARGNLSDGLPRIAANLRPYEVCQSARLDDIA